MRLWLTSGARLRDADKFPVEKSMTWSGTGANISLGCCGLKSCGLHGTGAIHVQLLFTPGLQMGVSKPEGQKGWLWAPISYAMPLLTSLAAFYPLPRWYLWFIAGSDRIKHSVLVRPFHIQAQPADWLLQSIIYFSSISWANLHVWDGWIFWTLHPPEFLHACQKMGSSVRGSSTGMQV